jgi:UrcA family protein
MLKSSLSLTLAAVLAAEPALAEEPIRIVAGQPTLRVSHADLDLRSDAGRAALEGRVHRAAFRLCADNGVRDIERQIMSHSCIAKAVASAAPQIDLAVANRGRTRLAAGRSVTVTLRR